MKLSKFSKNIGIITASFLSLLALQGVAQAQMDAREPDQAAIGQPAQESCGNGIVEGSETCDLGPEGTGAPGSLCQGNCQIDETLVDTTCYGEFVSNYCEALTGIRFQNCLTKALKKCEGKTEDAEGGTAEDEVDPEDDMPEDEQGIAEDEVDTDPDQDGAADEPGVKVEEVVGDQDNLADQSLDGNGGQNNNAGANLNLLSGSGGCSFTGNTGKPHLALYFAGLALVGIALIQRKSLNKN